MNQKLEQAMKNLEIAEKRVNQNPKPKTIKQISVTHSLEGEGTVTPKIIKQARENEIPKQKVPQPQYSEKQRKLREYIQKTNSLYTVNKDTPYEKYYATASAWSYLARLNNVHVQIDEVKMQSDMINGNVKHVIATGRLIDNTTEETITGGSMCASTNEKFLQDKPLSAAYGLAQTRLEERLLRMRFGYQLALAHLEPIGAEELDLDNTIYQNKEKEI